MIFRFQGNMRSGKTLGAVTWGIFLSEQTNQPIWSNIPKLTIPYQYFEKWKDLKRAKNAIIIFDELDTTIDSRNWGSGDQIYFTHLFKQMGKLGLTFLYTSQREHMVEKRIRDQTDYEIDCSKNWLTGKLRQDWYDIQSGTKKLAIKTYILPQPSVFYGFYDSFAVIETQIKTTKLEQFKND